MRQPTLPCLGENKDHEQADMDMHKLIGAIRIDGMLGSGGAS